ncbi:MAG: AIR synthase family protein [Chloroflexota bacterium]|nr:AIR synthase family protein [Chloroflexota bacterium]
MTTKEKYYPVGKLPPEDLFALLGALPVKDPRVILGPGIGHDAAVIEFGERLLVTKSDPITFATDEIGWYAVHVNANDIACLGATPRWFVATLLLPEGKTTPALVTEIFQQSQAACAELGVTLVGGHTEITHDLNRPIMVGTMFGEVSPQQLVRSDGARPGDKILLTKGIAVEGCALLARERGEQLQNDYGLPAELLTRAAQFLHEPGISVVCDAAIATASGDVHAMHDPTEGGVATGLHELTTAAGVGAVIDEQSLPLFPETQALCPPLGIDPLGLIASGALLAAVAPQDAAQIIAALRTNGIAAQIIGSIRAEPGVYLRGPAGERPLPQFPRDEISRLFEA